MKLNQTKLNGSVRLCSTCKIIKLTKKTVVDFIRLLKYNIIEQLPAIEFDRHFVGFCLIRYARNLTSKHRSIYRIYSINHPGLLLNFWTLRVGAYSRLGAY